MRILSRRVHSSTPEHDLRSREIHTCTVGGNDKQYSRRHGGMVAIVDPRRSDFRCRCSPQQSRLHSEHRDYLETRGYDSKMRSNARLFSNYVRFAENAEHNADHARSTQLLSLHCTVSFSHWRLTSARSRAFHFESYRGFNVLLRICAISHYYEVNSILKKDCIIKSL